jgi:hypothetical protein
MDQKGVYVDNRLEAAPEDKMRHVMIFSAGAGVKHQRSPVRRLKAGEDYRRCGLPMWIDSFLVART